MAPVVFQPHPLWRNPSLMHGCIPGFKYWPRLPVQLTRSFRALACSWKNTCKVSKAMEGIKVGMFQPVALTVGMVAKPGMAGVRLNELISRYASRDRYAT